jgi:hypothetical protein
MPAFMSQARGTVVRLDAASAELGAAAFAVRIQGLEDVIGNTGRSDSRVLITQVSRIEAGSFQLQHTFGNTIYAYIFGDRIGELKLSGICFAGGCNGQSSGIDSIHETYEQNRIAIRTLPLIITFGGAQGVIGLLTGFSSEVADAETQLMQWSFRINTFRAVS